ncbi:MAG: YaiO family outer membrane beta-barrel protein [Gemmatimonadota bacterium]
MTRSILSAASVLWLAAVVTPDVQGQSDEVGDTESRWQAAAIYTHQNLRDQSDWRSVSLLGGWASTMHTVVVEMQVLEREAVREAAFGADLYQDLPGGGYATGRGRFAAEGDVLPRLLAGADVYRPVWGPWEGWVGYEYRAYPGSNVHTFGAGPGVYVDRWYLRVRPSVSRAGGETTVVGKFLARRIIDDSSTDYIELGAGAGSEFVEIVREGAGAIEIEARDTWLISARAQRFVTRNLGVTAGGVYQTYDVLGARPTLTVGVLGRW